MRVQRLIPLAPFTTLGLGGPAARFVDAMTDDDVEELLRDRSASDPLLIMGGGSNLVVADEGFPGLVMRIAGRGVVTATQGDRVVIDAAAGEPWDDLVRLTVEQGWSGLESLSGIPGWIGAVPVQNVGAYGQDVGETIVSVRAFDYHALTWNLLSAKDCRFAYRSSLFKEAPGRYAITRVRFALRTQSKTARARYPELAKTLGVSSEAEVPLMRIREAVMALRRGKGMVVDPADPDSRSAGSFFVNPFVSAGDWDVFRARVLASLPNVPDVPRFPMGDAGWKVPAAWLIERAGFVKGYGEGAIGISSKHALALVNRGNGTTRELLNLVHQIQDGVRGKFGVTLSPEPCIVAGL